ncbi:MAG: serine/threonine-protein kinase, partial [Acidobacteriota bacterium]
MGSESESTRGGLARWREIESALDRASEESPSTPDPKQLESEPASPLDRPIDEVFGGLLNRAMGSLRSGEVGGEPVGPGDEIGAYRLEAVLGEGGMGTVFRAVRADGSFEQEVALKVLHRGPADEGARRRFLQERQILASLRHPHIARLLDGGVIGRVPYLVMERIDGVPITDFCRRRSASAELCVRLFLQVCGAMRYAHRQGVIHRDLKPSNLLVEEAPSGDGSASEPRVAVLDFGIARLEGAGPLVTATGQIFGTPGYMSPEQARGDRSRVDSRSDLFSLGAVLYEMLTGHRPFEGRDAPEVLSRLAAADMVPIRHRLPGISPDLETIVETCLHSEPRRRYASVRTLGDDLERFLEGLPISARPIASLERWQRLARRRPKTTAFVAGALGVSLTSLIALGLMAVRHTQDLRAERNAAEAARQDAEGLLEFMLEDLHLGLDRIGRLDLLEKVARQSLEYYRRRPSLASGDETLRRAQALFNAGEILESQGDREAALDAYRQNLRVFERLVATEPTSRWRLELARSHQTIATALWDTPEADSALEHISRALELTRGLQAEGWDSESWAKVHFRCLSYMGWLLRDAGAFEEAAALLEEARAFAERRAEPGPESVGEAPRRRSRSELDWQRRHAVALSYLGLARLGERSLLEAEEAFLEARTLCEEVLEAYPADVRVREELQLTL